jgi:hypothetical protein
MKRNLSLFIAISLVFSSAFGQDEVRVRGDFLKSREKTNSRPANPPARTKKPAPPKPVPELRVGFGYTVFLKDEAERWVRVSPKRTFVSGQQIRLLLESNTDGYLYIFHQENDGKMTLFYPNPQIQNGNNRIRANRPLLVPEGTAWRFDNKPAIETLTFIVSRVPVKGIPIDSALNQIAEFHPPQDVLQQINSTPNPIEDSVADDGKMMTETERGRGIELVPTDPAPTSVFMGSAKGQDRIVVKLKLTHK